MKKDGAPADQRTALKVRIKELAQEARYIRREEEKTRWREERDWLKVHRRRTVRRAARFAQLAYGYIRGVPYRVMEAKVHDEDYFMMDEVVRLVWEYGRWRHPFNPEKIKAGKEEVRTALKAWFSALD